MNEEHLQRLKPQELLQMIEQQAGLARSMTDYMLPTDDVDWRNPQPLVEFGDFVVYARFKDQPQADPGFPLQNYDKFRTKTK